MEIISKEALPIWTAGRRIELTTQNGPFANLVTQLGMMQLERLRIAMFCGLV